MQQILEKIEVAQFDDFHSLRLLFGVVAVVADDAIGVFSKQRFEEPLLTIDGDGSVIIVFDDDSFVLSTGERETRTILADDTGDLLFGFSLVAARIDIRK